MSSPQKVVIGDVALYHGDCLEVMDAIPMVDIVVTSPPYNKLSKLNGGGLFGQRWQRTSKRAYPDSMPEKEYEKYILARVDKCLKRARGLVWVNHKIRFKQLRTIHPARFFPYPIWSEVIWDRCGSQAFKNSRFAHSHEVIYGFGRPHYWNRSYERLMSVWRHAPVHHEEHPCVFPPKLIEPLILASCPFRGIVLDPFAGTGTVGVVAMAHGRRAVLIEKEKRLFDVACRRIETAYSKHTRKHGGVYVNSIASYR